jgi:ESS family glutamate:Na+ symporter
MTFTPVETVAAAALLLLAGYWLRGRIAVLDRLNMPAPVIGGLTAAVGLLILRHTSAPAIRFDAVAQQPLMIAFFTSVGFAASFKLIRRGGPQVIMLLVVSSAAAALQGLVGAGVAVLFHKAPLFGVLTSIVTLSGGPATGLAFAPQFQAEGVAGAATIATACGVAGILMASLFGSPMATALIAGRRLDPRLAAQTEVVVATVEVASTPAAIGGDHAFTALKTIAVILAAMALGGWVSAGIRAAGVTLPAYIGAMLVAASLRNLDDATGWLKLSLPAIELAGAVTLSLFLVLAMMTLDPSLLGGLALPLVVGLLVQLVLMVAMVLGPVWWLMGRDYDAAVTAGGFAGYMLGITANAMAIMRALVEKYGEAPRAFLTVPVVGGFFLDFTNALIITGFLNLWR